MDAPLGFDEGGTKTRYGKVHYAHRKGSGAALVFLHGFGSSIRAWNRLMGYLDKGFDVYLLDLLGHGASDAPEMEYRLSVQVDALDDFLEGSGITDPILVGHSYGGWICAAYAMSHRVRKLVLEDPAGAYASYDQMSKSKDIMYKEAMKVSGNHDYVLKSIMESTGEGDLLTKEKLSRISAPTLIVWGEDDKVVGREAAGAFKEGIANSALKVVAGAGHVPHYEKAEEFAALLKAFAEEDDGLKA